MNFATFKTTVKSVAFPLGEAENLVAIHDTFIVEALADIQKYVPCYRTRNVDIVAFSDTKFNCGLSVIGAPDGRLTHVRTVSSNFCCQVNYFKTTLAQLRNWEAYHKINFADSLVPTQPPIVNSSPSPIGDLIPDASANSNLGRANTGYWALEGCRLYLWPHIQSDEDLMLEWEGLKTSYADNDLIFDPRAVTAVRARLLRDIAKNIDGNDADAVRHHSTYQEQLGELYHWCRLKTESTYAEEENLPILTNGCVTTENINDPMGTKDDATNATEDETVFAILGEFGNDAPGSLAVSSLIAQWKPSYVLTTGGNNLYPEQSVNAYDRAVAKKFARFLFPYPEKFGVYGAGSTDYNRFWPSVSSNDRVTPIMLSSYRRFFSAIPAANGRLYYDRIEGPMHWFFVDSDSATPDGNTQTSAQAEWLRVKLASSTSPFKVVVMYHPPFSSDTAYANLRWTYKTWGATLVIDGKSRVYERIAQGNLQYITNGLGGAALGSFSTITPGSLIRYAANYGAIKGTVTCKQVKFEFISIDAVVQDTIIIAHE